MSSVPRRGQLVLGAVFLAGGLAMSASGCLSGNFDSTMRSDGGGEPDQAARDQFVAQVSPAMAGSGCNTCHTAPGLPPAPLFGNTFDSVTTYNAGSLINCTDTSLSLLVTKGAHPPGTAFLPADLPTVTSWLDVFCGGGVAPGAAVTGSFVPQLNVENSVDLSGLAPGLTGARITFTPTMVTGGIYLSGIKAVAGTGGLKVKTPVFEACITGTSRPDPGNAFSTVDLTVPAGQTLNIGGGTMSFVGWELDNPMAIRFTALEPEAGPGGAYTPGAGSCGAAL